MDRTSLLSTRVGARSQRRKTRTSNRQEQLRRLRRLRLEALEQRRLLAADLESADAELLIAPLPPIGPAQSQSAPSAGPFANTETFKLHSKPDSNYTLYLDFDGHVTEGTNWNRAENPPNSSNQPTIVSPAYDTDGDPASFSAAEHDVIQKAWQIVAEDFAPFDINVTTEEPSDLEDLRKDQSGTDTRWGTRAIQTIKNWNQANVCGCGGFAYRGSFDTNRDEPSFTFNHRQSFTRSLKRSHTKRGISWVYSMTGFRPRLRRLTNTTTDTGRAT